MTQMTGKMPAVLVVEDEPLIRLDVVDMIEDAGFKTYEASNADAAIALMDRHADIGILFTDIDMPGSMNGLALAGYVRNSWPGVAIMVASGVVGVEASALPDGATFFAKPYATQEIMRAIDEIAAERR